MRKPIIAFQGRLGAYSESACLHLFGNDAFVLPLSNFEKVYQAVMSGDADYGVLPVENSTAGSILDNFDLMRKYRLPIVAEVVVMVEHSLMVAPGVTLDQLTGLRSHPQALAQCSKFFEANPHIRAIPEYDTAGSAEIVAEKGGSVGAIASALAAEEYGLDILIPNLENERGLNQTRFWCIARDNKLLDLGEANKISLVFEPLENKPGVLHQALKLFADRNLDLLKIESRPQPARPWQYIFYLDLKGSLMDPHVHEAVELLKPLCHDLHIMGNYASGQVKPLHKNRS